MPAADPLSEKTNLSEQAGPPEQVGGLSRPILVRGARVHNLQSVDVDIPRHQLVAICGVSGSGKTSLALDTLYAEGQRRYIESFSAYTRQFLQRLDKPDCESLEGLPPAIAVTRSGGHRGNRSTVATATETADYLRLLFAKVAQLNCYNCGAEVRTASPQTVAVAVQQLSASLRLMLGFPVWLPNRVEAAEILADLQTQGFLRLVLGEQTFHLSDENRQTLAKSIDNRRGSEAVVIVDRLRSSEESARLTESLETAFAEGNGEARLLLEPLPDGAEYPAGLPVGTSAKLLTVDGGRWVDVRLNQSRRCDVCDIDYPDPEPRLFSFNHPLGACPECEGFGDVMELDMDLIVPDRTKSLREGAIAPWTSPSYRHELHELLEIARRRKLPVDVPFAELPAEVLQLIQEGSEADDFGGLRGFFAWLERKKYKMHVRVFLSRWRTYRRCPTCQGRRLRPHALAYHVGGKDLATLMELEVEQAIEFFAQLELTSRAAEIADELLAQIQGRLGYLRTVGLGYLQLSRTLRTLSGGESQRVALTGALGSSLVNMLYVLDEPTAGLHPHDVDRLCEAIVALRDRGNTVVAVEHDEAIMRRADHLIELGPGAGTMGGRLVFSGNLAEMVASPNSITGDFIAGRRGKLSEVGERRPPRGWLRLSGASGNNLKDLEVAFPLGVLCLVTGVSGSGKSSLVMQTLHGALCKRKRKSTSQLLPYRDLIGDGQLEDVLLIDQSPISRSPRSNPVTYIKAFDAIRAVFAETVAARTRGLTAGHFSFNSEKGRCETCQGDGVLAIDMQFLADITMRCPACQGTRYRPEILQIRYRDRNIAECLQMTVRQGMSFFRGHEKLLKKLQRLIDVGLEYVGLGQSATTLSSGEAQRLKLAGFLATARRRRTLFILDEPSTGLHFADIVKLIDCFDALVADGHSLIVVEHNLQLMRAADYIIDLGPGAAAAGGQIVAEGTPDEIAKVAESRTGACLRRE